MREKAETKYANNLCEIRKSQDLKQVDMAEILKVNVQTYREYERWRSCLPADKAMILVKEYGYSLDYIYCLSKEKKTLDEKFMIDIRRLVNIDEENNIVIEFSNSYMDYLLEKGKVQYLTGASSTEKINRIQRIDGHYFYVDTGIFYEFKIGIDEFQRNFIHKGRKTLYVENSRVPELKILSTEAEEEINRLFEEIIDADPKKRNIKIRIKRKDNK